MIFQYILVITAIIGVIATLMTVVGANIYDLRHIRINRQLSQQPNARRYRRRPLITLIIPTQNNAGSIEHTLRSIIQSSYRKLEIIVVDSNSGDATAKIVRQFIASNPKKKIRLIAKRKAVPAVQALADAYRAHAAGELIFWLEPGQLPAKQALAKAVQHFNTEPRLGALRCNRQVDAAYSTVGLLQRFVLLLGSRTQKFSSATNTDYAGAGAGIIYSRALLSQLLLKKGRQAGSAAHFLLAPLRLGNRETQLCYGGDVLVHTPPPASFAALLSERYHLQLHRLESLKSYRRLFLAKSSTHSKFLTLVRLPLAVGVGAAAIFVPLLLSYFLYLAVYLRQPALYGLTAALIILFTVFAIWGDEQLTLAQKARYSLLSPIVQGVLYLLSFIQIFVVVRSLFSGRDRTAQT